MQTNTQFPVVIPKVRRVVLKGATFTAPIRDYAMINSATKVRTDGTILQDGTFVVVGRCTPGVKADLFIDYASPVDLTHVIGMAGQPCALFSCEGMEIYR
jgi:hypothetical protein